MVGGGLPWGTEAEAAFRFVFFWDAWTLASFDLSAYGFFFSGRGS